MPSNREPIIQGFTQLIQGLTSAYSAANTTQELVASMRAALVADVGASPADANPAESSSPLLRRIEGFLRTGQGARADRRMAALHAAVAFLAVRVIQRLRPGSDVPTVTLVFKALQGDSGASTPPPPKGDAFILTEGTDATALAWWRGRGIMPSRLLKQAGLYAVDDVTSEAAVVGALAFMARTARTAAHNAMPPPPTERVADAAAAEASLEAVLAWPAGRPSGRQEPGTGRQRGYMGSATQLVPFPTPSPLPPGLRRGRLELTHGLLAHAHPLPRRLRRPCGVRSGHRCVRDLERRAFVDDCVPNLGGRRGG